MNEEKIMREYSQFKVSWYFDFISPFAYIQHSLFDKLPKGLHLEYKPILFAGLLKHWGNVGPAEIPPKRKFTYQHSHWLAKKYDVDFKMPPAHPFNSLAALRLALAIDTSRANIQTIFNSIWKKGYALDSTVCIEYLISSIPELAGYSYDTLTNLISHQKVKDQLINNTEEAATRNIFGVPTFYVEHDGISELFWGLDAFDMFLEYIDEPSGFRTMEHQRIAHLPEGVQRKR